ncbi:hypothetical protein ACFL42_00575 [Candidatus Omnitrophota bacterium]
MKKEYLLGILFFGSLWGASEALLGGFLYNANYPHASVSLTVIAFAIMTAARIYLPKNGTSTLIASVAMLYKFLNTPFFACHLLAIFLLGVSYDIVFGYFKIRSRAISGFISAYLGYILFALTITYVFRYHYWTQGGMPKILRYVGTSGSMAAALNLFFVPFAFSAGKFLKKNTVDPFCFRSKLATGCVSLITVAIWVFGAARWF